MAVLVPPLLELGNTCVLVYLEISVVLVFGVIEDEKAVRTQEASPSVAASPESRSADETK